jgi:hypothetical protein
LGNNTYLFFIEIKKYISIRSLETQHAAMSLLLEQVDYARPLVLLELVTQLERRLLLGVGHVVLGACIEQELHDLGPPTARYIPASTPTPGYC